MEAGSGNRSRLFQMTREEHKEFRESIRDDISKVATLLQKPVETEKEEIYRLIDSLSKLEVFYNDAINTLDNIESKLYHHFK